MRLLVLASAASLIVSGAAMASQSVRTHHISHHHFHHDTDAPAADGVFPADVLGTHETYIENLRDSGYNPHSDFDAAGNIRAN
jgi:hypothetical protein